MEDSKSTSNFDFLEKPVPITEQEWGEGVTPLVSISCTTYNHERYIRDAIEGFLKQETTFPVEINIHDDASTDNTANIIREYEEKYPQLLFNPIYQTENQYSKRDGTIRKIQQGRTKGKYYAICEGDDYWTDPLKLQKQVEVFDSYPSCSLCFHAVKYKYENLPDKDFVYRPKGGSHDRFYSMKDFIIGGGDFIPTASMTFKREYVEDLPDWYHKATGGDYSLTLILATKGKVRFLSEVMGVYRKGVIESWSHNRTVKHKLNLSRELIDMYYSFNKWSRYQYIFPVFFQVARKKLVNIKQQLIYMLKKK